ncbi:hypothetical protein HR12_19870 [Microbacterium sp. SUBG005]|nr:hypothetical protein HR12_19870 [Microbacterium sp. SUBG005]
MDSVKLTDPMKQEMFQVKVAAHEILPLSWDDFRQRARKANEAFLEARDQAAAKAKASAAADAAAASVVDVPAEVAVPEAVAASGDCKPVPVTPAGVAPTPLSVPRRRSGGRP